MLTPSCPSAESARWLNIVSSLFWCGPSLASKEFLDFEWSGGEVGRDRRPDSRSIELSGGWSVKRSVSQLFRGWDDEVTEPLGFRAVGRSEGRLAEESDIR